ncbi:hypothetical protein GCM10022220_56400 [Actinocatenispora rupis]
MATHDDLPAEPTAQRLRRWPPSDAEKYRGSWLERDPRALRRTDAQGRPTVDDPLPRRPASARDRPNDTTPPTGYCGSPSVRRRTTSRSWRGARTAAGG